MGYQCWGHLWTSLKLLCSSLCSAEQLTGTGTLCSHSLLASRQVSSVTSLAVRHPMLCLLGCQLSSLTKKGFFFFNSRFQLSNDSDTAARVKRSSSPSELYGRRPWVSSLKESLLGPAISWIQLFNWWNEMLQQCCVPAGSGAVFQQ